MAASCRECDKAVLWREKVLEYFHIGPSRAHRCATNRHPERPAIASCTVPEVPRRIPIRATRLLEDEPQITMWWMGLSVGLPPNPEAADESRTDEASLAILGRQLKSGYMLNGIEQAVILGSPRTGKTTLATVYAWKHLEDYGCITWVDCSTLDAARTTFTAQARKVGYRNTLSDRGVASWEDILHRFSRTGRARDLGCLIVFDNVHDHRIVDEFWPLPGSNTAVIVITSDESIAQAYAALGPQTASSSMDSGGADTFEW